MSSTWGNNIKISLFGESHGQCVGVTIDGLPAGEALDEELIQAFMNRRRPASDSFSTPRRESDIPNIVSGIKNGATSGSPLTAIIPNEDARSADYAETKRLARPSHADYSAFVKYNGSCDMRGGGHFSGRLTAPLVFAGAVAAQILSKKGITVGAHILRIGSAADEPFRTDIPEDLLIKLAAKPFPVINDARGEEMRAIITEARSDGDSVGGIIECAATGVRAGIGAPIFDGVENRISSIVFGIPAVKGIEFGAGFGFSSMRGLRANDEMYFDDCRAVRCYSNNNGGVCGGITNGMPIVFRAAVKPTPSIALPQRTVDLAAGTNAVIEIKGRHDACIAPRAVPVIEAAAAIAILDLLMEGAWT